MTQKKPFIINTGPISIEEAEVKGQKKDYVKGFISTDDLDLVNDVVTQKCFDSMIRQLKDRTIKLDFEHEAFRGENNIEKEINKTKIPLGKRIDWQRKSSGVEVTWELNPTWKQVNSKGDIIHEYKDVKYNLKNGFYDAFTICFFPIKTRKENVKGQDVRLLDDLNLLNVALTGNAVNPKAQISKIFTKSLDSIKKTKAPKRPKPKVPESEEEEEEEKKKEGKSNHSRKDIIKLKERKMSEEKEETTEESKPSEETSNEENSSKEEESKKAKKVDEDESEEDEEEEEEEDSKKEVKALKEKVEKLESQIKKPVRKGQISDMKKAESKSVNFQGPLDLIC